MEDQTYNFDVYRLGFEQVPKSTVTLASIQKPLKKLYILYQKAVSTNPPLSRVRLNANKRGLSVASILNTSEEQSSTFMNEALITDNQVAIRAALAFTTLTNEKKTAKYKAAFVNLDPEVKTKNEKEYNALFSSLDEKEMFLVSIEHPPLFVCVNRTRNSKNLELRVFACSSDEQALDIMKALKGETIVDYGNKSYGKSNDGETEASGKSSLTTKPSIETESNSGSVSSTVTSQPNQETIQQPLYETYPQQGPNGYEQGQYFNHQMPQSPYANQGYPPNAYYPYPPYGNPYHPPHFMHPYPPQQQQGIFSLPTIQTNQSSQAPISSGNLHDNIDVNLSAMKVPRPTIDQSKLNPPSNNRNPNSATDSNLNDNRLNENHRGNPSNHTSNPDPGNISLKSENNDKEQFNPTFTDSQYASIQKEASDQRQNVIRTGAQSIYPRLSPTETQNFPLAGQFFQPPVQQMSSPVQQVSPPFPVQQYSQFSQNPQSISSSIQNLSPSAFYQCPSPSSASNSFAENSQTQLRPDELIPHEIEPSAPKKERVAPAVPTKKPAVPPPVPKPVSHGSSFSDEMLSPSLIGNGKESLHLIEPKKLRGVHVLPFPVKIVKGSPEVDERDKNLAVDMQQGLNLNEADRTTGQQVHL